jgi:predicted peptidase
MPKTWTFLIAGFVLLTALLLGTILLRPAEPPSVRQTVQRKTIQAADVYHPKTGRKVTFGYLQYLPANHATSSDLYPVLIFLHGYGERDGDGIDIGDLEKLKVHGPPKLIQAGQDMCVTAQGVRSCFIVLSPQLPITDEDWSDEFIKAMLEEAKTLRGDPERIYLTGLSMGGGGTWTYANGHPEELAAALPIAGSGDTFALKGCKISSGQLPVWAFHGLDDDVVSPRISRTLVERINGVNDPVRGKLCPANPVRALLTEYAGVKHDSWTQTYDPEKRFDPKTGQPSANGINVYEWLLSHRR